MEARELMIGDWVKVNIDKTNSANMKIGMIDWKGCWCIKDDDDDIYNFYKFDTIKPISLTEEIIDKNNIEKDTDDINIEWYSKSDNYTQGFYSYLCISNGCANLEEVPYDYVHELQHILKICGLNELADNFKIK